MSQFGIEVKKTRQDVRVSVADAAKFRVMPKPELDAKGRVKPFKPDRKDPDRKLGGVRGSDKDLRERTWVVAKLSRPRKGGTHVADVVVVLGEEETK